MTPNARLDEILRLPPAERLRLVEDVWNSLAASPDAVGVPDWHREELDRRLADPTEQFGVAPPFTAGRCGARARVEYTSHSCNATAAKLAPSVEASNTARKQRVVTGAKSMRLSALSVSACSH